MGIERMSARSQLRVNDPRGKPEKQERYAKADWRLVVAVASCVILLVVCAYAFLSSSPEKLLERDTLTPDEIRVVATELLRHENFKVRAKAAAKLLACGAPAVPVLKDIGLNHSDPELRQAVVGILASLNDEAAIEVASAMMDDPDSESRQRAVDAATKINHPEASRLLSSALDDEDASIRSYAAGMAGSTHTREAVPKLKSLLDDPDPRVRRHTRRALKEITGVDYPD